MTRTWDDALALGYRNRPYERGRVRVAFAPTVNEGRDPWVLPPSSVAAYVTRLGTIRGLHGRTVSGRLRPRAFGVHPHPDRGQRCAPTARNRSGSSLLLARHPSAEASHSSGIALARHVGMKTLLPMLALVGLSCLSLASTACEVRERVVVRRPEPAVRVVYTQPPVVQERVIVR